MCSRNSRHSAGDGDRAKKAVEKEGFSLARFIRRLKKTDEGCCVPVDGTAVAD